MLFCGAPEGLRRGKCRSWAILSEFFSNAYPALPLPRILLEGYKKLIKNNLDIVNNS